MRRTTTIGLLVFALAVFAFADHRKRPTPDYQVLEQWRVSGVKGACAPCGAVCDDS